VRAELPTGNKAAIHVRPTAVRAVDAFPVGNTDAISAKYGRLLHARTYGYAFFLSLAREARMKAFDKTRSAVSDGMSASHSSRRGLRSLLTIR
jgi:hypothetical protein